MAEVCKRPPFTRIFSLIIKNNLISFPPLSEPPVLKIEGIKKFASEEDFKSYLQETQLRYFGGLGMLRAARMPLIEEDFEVSAPALEALGVVRSIGNRRKDFRKSFGNHGSGFGY